MDANAAFLPAALDMQGPTDPQLSSPLRFTPIRRTSFLALAVAAATIALSVSPVAAFSPLASGAASKSEQHAFDWEIGSWTTKVRVRRNPLSREQPDWAEYEGTSIVRPLLDGRANFVELSVAGPRGKIEGGALRLYNPQARQWNVNYASLGNGLLTAPVYGAFGPDGRGLFYGQDMLGGRAISVRFIITRVSPNVARFEQAYSVDGGNTWENNWLAVDTRR
jgi:hypothetical protein